jgi:4-hydroxy 2-oxovalerate aldolase
MKILETQILDCTMRDGSYAVNFQFSSDLTGVVSSGLDQLGIPLIEVGHGIGLGASRISGNSAAASDVEYMHATSQSVVRGDWGMFCIAEIGTIYDLEMAKEFGMDFVRIGCEVNETEKAKLLIEHARKIGLYVFSNLMKSYAIPAKHFALSASECIKYGAQCVYIVDSAGGMLPHQIKTYAKALRDLHPDVNIGFHGHNNIGMAVANTLSCIEDKFYVVDTSLQGIGRSSGNAPTEQLYAALIRSDFEVDIDIIELMDLSEVHIKPFMRAIGIDSLDLSAGLALFHSSYLKKVLEVSSQFKIDPRRLVIEICKHDRISAPNELILSCAKRIYDSTGQIDRRFSEKYYGQEQK